MTEEAILEEATYRQAILKAVAIATTSVEQLRHFTRTQITAVYSWLNDLEPPLAKDYLSLAITLAFATTDQLFWDETLEGTAFS